MPPLAKLKSNPEEPCFRTFMVNGDPETVAAVKVRVAVWTELVCPTLIERFGGACAFVERTANRKQAKRAGRSILTKALHSEINWACRDEPTGTGSDGQLFEGQV